MFHALLLMAVSIIVSLGTFLSTRTNAQAPSGPPEMTRAGAGQELPPCLTALQAAQPGQRGPRHHPAHPNKFMWTQTQ